MLSIRLKLHIFHLQAVDTKNTNLEDGILEELRPNISLDVDKIDVNISHPKYVTLANNTITLTAHFWHQLSYTNADYIYKWNVDDTQDTIKTSGDNQPELRIYNLTEGTYPYYFKIIIKDTTSGQTLAVGQSQGDFRVFPGTSYFVS